MRAAPAGCARAGASGAGPPDRARRNVEVAGTRDLTRERSGQWVQGVLWEQGRVMERCKGKRGTFLCSKGFHEGTESTRLRFQIHDP